MLCSLAVYVEMVDRGRHWPHPAPNTPPTIPPNKKTTIHRKTLPPLQPPNPQPNPKICAFPEMHTPCTLPFTPSYIYFDAHPHGFASMRLFHAPACTETYDIVASLRLGLCSPPRVPMLLLLLTLRLTSAAAVLRMREMPASVADNGSIPGARQRRPAAAPHLGGVGGPRATARMACDSARDLDTARAPRLARGRPSVAVLAKAMRPLHTERSALSFAPTCLIFYCYGLRLRLALLRYDAFHGCH